MQAPSDHRFQTIADAKAFALAGNAIITLQSLRSGTHFTYKVVSPSAEKQEQKGYTPEQVWFVKLLTSGSADSGEWSYIGMIKPNQGFFLTRASKMRPESACVKAFRFFFESTELHSGLVVHHEGHCGRCGRTLTVPESIERGIGPECAAKMEGGDL
jgi:Family of unknown function (DUF6011)